MKISPQRSCLWKKHFTLIPRRMRTMRIFIEVGFGMKFRDVTALFLPPHFAFPDSKTADEYGLISSLSFPPLWIFYLAAAYFVCCAQVRPSAPRIAFEAALPHVSPASQAPIHTCISIVINPIIRIIMSDVLRSILCGEDYWYWDPHGGCTIKFNKDGTGEVNRTTHSSSLETSWTVYKLLCAAELLLWIAAEFEWKLQNIESLDQTVDLRNVIDDARKNHPRLIGRFTIELTLSKRCFPRLRQSVQGRQFNESLLIDDAFLPKAYTITLEKGFFKTPYDVIENEYTQRYALRLVWEPSPYPPREEWKGAQASVEAHKFWEHKIFCGRSSEELRKLANRRWWEKLYGLLGYVWSYVILQDSVIFA